ncbi:PsiF family protein [Methylobacterium sp. J-030]|uniref:PsiF family protein n=1 Tax=Methylobacterium sp. J-030 TaxID=2836627 RepID=UPI001FBACCF7|nr:PsiF family protein [Methylobacterium sp. J-030]MCJ2067350.1 PsiF family protein [Methylobacterium sp. J-030]
MRRSILAATALAALITSTLAQNAPAPADKPGTGSVQGDDTMTDVDPELLAGCKREAAQKKLKGAERATFMNTCVEPED